MKIVRRIAKWIAAILGILVVVVLAQFGWGIYREPIAKQEAIDFCATVKVGQSTDGIQERAIANGAMKSFAKWSTGTDGSQSMLVIFVGLPPFSRHICGIKANKEVISAHYRYID